MKSSTFSAQPLRQVESKALTELLEEYYALGEKAYDIAQHGAHKEQAEIVASRRQIWNLICRRKAMNTQDAMAQINLVVSELKDCYENERLLDMLTMMESIKGRIY